MKNRILRFLICLGAHIFSTSAFCTSYIANAVTTPNPIQPHGYGYKLEFGWPSEESPDMSLPCRQSHCYLGISVTIVTPTQGRIYSPQYAVMMVTYTNGELLSRVRARWIGRHGETGIAVEPNWMSGANTPYADTGLGCMQYWPFWGVPGTLGVNVPQTVCNAIPPPNVTCDSLPDMVFDFGTVPSGDTSGLRLSQQQSLRCSNATNVTLKLATDLKLTDMLTANVTVNGRPLDTHGVTLAVGRNTTPLDFVVTTNGNENTGGEYTASSVLIMEYR